MLNIKPLKRKLPVTSVVYINICSKQKLLYTTITRYLDIMQT